MPFPLLTLVPGLLRTVAKFVAGGDILTKAAEALENVSVPPEKQAEMQKELAQHEEAMEAFGIERAKLAVLETTTMVESTDKWVARARPTGLYMAYIATLALVIATIFNLPLDHTLVLELILPMYGAQGYYMHLRTKEKLNTP